ncbi:MAG: heterodisulfide reductase-related iron-sulfur binding cluster [Candidatus Sulfotelmatobacter sp.]|jgi:heterodisulfide reductase subunit B
MASASIVPITKAIPENDFFLTPSCILGAINPGTEVLISRIYDLLGLRWSAAGDRPDSQCTCCTGILSHGDIMSMESTLLVVARLWSIAAELGFENITTSCVTSFAIHTECLELYEHEAGLRERVERWLQRACGRRLQMPKHVVHASDIVYRYRQALAKKLQYRLIDHRTERPLRIVDHVGCHYAKVFPDKAVGGSESCDVLAGVIRAWGGETVDYPERHHCCGMGFRQCMIRPNRGYTMACVLKKLDSMEPWEPDAILTNCPGCNVMLDKGQWAIEQMCGRAFNIPTLSYTELAGLLLGWDPYDVVGIQAHTVPVEPLLDTLGIPYDKSKEWLAKEEAEVT